MRKPKLNIEDLNDISRLHKEGIYIKDIAKKYNVNYNTLSIFMKKNNIKINRGYSGNRRRYVNQSFFEKIDTKEKAYLIGLICSDASIDNTGYAFTFTSKDFDQISLFKNIIESEHKICDVRSFDKRTNKIYNRYTIHICSRKLVNDLKKIGISNNKSFTCKLPKISKNLFWHFFRGLFDGDGCIYKKNKSKEGKLRFSLIGSSIMIIQIKNILNKFELTNTKISKSKYGTDDQKLRGGISKILFYSYKDLKFIYDKIYEDSDNLRLKRKFDIFSTLKEYKIGRYSRKLKKVIQKDFNNNIIKVFSNKFEASVLLNIGHRLIQRVLNGGRKHTHGFVFNYENID